MTAPTAARVRSARWADRLGCSGGGAGILAGLVEITVGASIGPWIGDKADPTRLGFVTVILGVVALLCAAALDAGDPPARRALLCCGMAVPALIGFTTVGRLWFVPGALLLTSSACAAGSIRGERRTVLSALERNGTRILATLLAVLYTALGLAALGSGGAVGVVGGLVALVTLNAESKIRRRWAVLLVAAAALPFAVVTWWSVVTPVVAALLVLFTLLRSRRRPSARAGGGCDSSRELARGSQP